MSNQSVGGIKICFDLSIPCKNIKVTWISQEGILTPCLDESGNKTNCIEIYPNPYATGDKCIEGWIFCDECLHGNNKPIYFKKCFCNTDADCTLECETCKQYGDVKVCEQSLTPQQIKEGRLCNGDCPPNKKYYNDVLKRCVECIEGTTHHLNKCLVCTNGEWKPKCPVCDPVTGKCVECISDDDCKNNTDGRTKCGPDGCQCLPGFHYDYVLKKCVPDDDCKLDTDCPECFVCDKITLPNGDIKKVCVPLECPKGYKCWKGKCHPWDCPDQSCDNGGDCAKSPDGVSRCGCTDRVFDDYVQRVCIPCELLKCDGECQNSLGCECDPVTNKCKSSDTCTQSYCDDFTPCDGPNCTCYEFQCVSCDNFPCDPDECSSRRNCGCVGGDCRGTGNPPGGGGGNCGDSLVINKDCDNCDLEAVLTSDGCKCSDIKTKVKSASFSNGKIKFEVDNFKGNYNFESYKTDDHFGDAEILKGLITYQIVIDGNPVYTGNTSIGNNNSNTIPDIEVDISSYIPKDASTKNIQIVFLQSGYTTESNDCTKYSEGTIGTFNYNLTKTNGVPIGIEKENIVKDDVSSKKPIFIWTKDSVVFRKVYPIKNGNTYTDKLSTAADGLELLKTYVVKTDCPGCGNSTATHASLEFCCLDKFAPLVTACGTKLSADPIKLCDVNAELTTPYLEINGNAKEWTSKIEHNGTVITSLRAYLKIKPGKFKVGQEICSTNYPIPLEKANISTSVSCVNNLVTGIIKEAAGLKIVDAKSNVNIITFKDLNTSTVTFTANNPAYLNAINTSNGIVITVETSSGCKVDTKLSSGTCNMSLVVTPTNANNTCSTAISSKSFDDPQMVKDISVTKDPIDPQIAAAADTGTIRAVIEGAGSLTGFTWTVNGVKIEGQSGSSITLSKLIPGKYTIKVEGNGINKTEEVTISNKNTLYFYDLEKTDGCGSTLGKITVKVTPPVTGSVKLKYGTNSYTVSKTLTSTVDGSTVIFDNLATGEYGPEFVLTSEATNKICGTKTGTISNKVTTKRIEKTDDICLDNVADFTMGSDITDQTKFNIKLTDGTYTSSGSAGTIKSTKVGSVVTICPKVADDCIVYTAGSGITIRTSDPDKGCFQYPLTYKQPITAQLSSNTCENNLDRFVVTIAPSNGVYQVDLLKKSDGSVISGARFTSQGAGSFLLSGSYGDEYDIRIADTVTGCKTTIPVAKKVTPCSSKSNCPNPLILTPITSCQGEDVRLDLPNSLFIAAGYPPNSIVSVYVKTQDNLVVTSKANTNINTNMYVNLVSSLFTQQGSQTFKVIINGEACGDRESSLVINTNGFQILGINQECGDDPCADCDTNAGYTCREDNANVRRCLIADTCADGAVNDPCSISCPCGENLFCSDTLGICLSEVVDIDCVCGQVVTIDGVAVGCNCTNEGDLPCEENQFLNCNPSSTTFIPTLGNVATGCECN